MKKINLSFYFIVFISLLPGLALVLFLALHPQPADYQLFRFLTGFDSSLIRNFASYCIIPKYWIPFYNVLLILLYSAFGNRFTKVIYGLLLVFLFVYLISTWSAALVLAGHGTSNGSLTRGQLTRLKTEDLFSYRHIAFVFALVTYLGIVLYDYYNGFKILFFCCAFLLLFCCIYSGTILPFAALTASFVGNMTACLVSPFYVRKFIYPEESTTVSETKNQ